MAHKQLSHVKVKNEDRGEVSAVFSTFNVCDHDRDVTLPGAFEEGAPVVISSYNHTSWGGNRPVGKGRIRTTKSEAIMDGQFFMDTADGRDTFTVVKSLSEAGLGEWSYGFDIQDSEPGKHEGADVQFIKRVKVFEVSPVLRGAGVNTRTLAMKALTETGMDARDASRIVERTVGMSDYRAAIRPHDIEVVEKEWVAKNVLRELGDGMTIADLRSVFAWCDPNGDPESRASYRFPHHHGPNGEANIRACFVALDELNFGKATIPEEDRQGVYGHLSSHIHDGERDPLELRAVGDNSPMRFQEQIVHTMVVNDVMGDRASEVMALRASKSKTVASAAADFLSWWRDSQRRTGALLDSPQDDAAREYLRYIQSQFDTGDPGE